ncbi:hypothetical protein NDU88_008839 [Pleurodeles waltl]|uniref:Uncharacterized protein n=1 Tax=Pleurodeles waltl TaxID=8319 RepID=A0AAV7P0G8_PLEWA|nr:hypothetical protein NDU88_008839 [Pleurodeles waltl]
MPTTATEPKREDDDATRTPEEATVRIFFRCRWDEQERRSTQTGLVRLIVPGLLQVDIIIITSRLLVWEQKYNKEKKRERQPSQ